MNDVNGNEVDLQSFVDRFEDDVVPSIKHDCEDDVNGTELSDFDDLEGLPDMAVLDAKFEKVMATVRRSVTSSIDF